LTQFYDFGDGQTSTELDISHTYAILVLTRLPLTVTDTESGMFNTATKTINVYKIPDNTIYTTDEIPACFGTSVTLRAMKPVCNMNGPMVVQKIILR
jgi:PKD repeat protein